MLAILLLIVSWVTGSAFFQSGRFLVASSLGWIGWFVQISQLILLLVVWRD